ncbi:hypothetical protein ACFY36_04060 [Actinoplanes sp. NPDC000266]
MNTTAAGTTAQVLAGLLLAVLLEGRWLLDNKDKVPFFVLSLFNALIGIAGTTLALTLSLSILVNNRSSGPLVTSMIVAGSAAAVFSVILPPFLFVLLAFVQNTNQVTTNRTARHALAATAVAIMLIAFAGLAYLVFLGIRLEMKAVT